jgi:hypothetical protein
MSKYEDFRVVSVLGGADDVATITSAIVPCLIAPATTSQDNKEEITCASKISRPVIPEQAVGSVLCGIWGSDTSRVVSASEVEEKSETTETAPIKTLYLSLLRRDPAATTASMTPTESGNISAIIFKMSMVAVLVSSLVVSDLEGCSSADTLDLIGKIALTASQFSSALPSSMAVTNVPKLLYAVDIANESMAFASTEGQVESAPGTFKVLGRLLREASQRQVVADRIDSFFGNSDEECKIHVINSKIDHSIPPVAPDVAMEDVDYLSLVDFSNVLTTALEMNMGDTDEPRADDAPTTYLQNVFPLLRSYVVAMSESIPTAVQQERDTSIDKSISAAVSAENDDWDGEDVEWSEAIHTSEIDDSMEASSHTLMSVDLTHSPAQKVDPAKLAAAVGNCMEAYRAVMLQQVKDPSVTPPALSLLGDAFIGSEPSAQSPDGPPSIRCGAVCGIYSTVFAFYYFAHFPECHC